MTAIRPPRRSPLRGRALSSAAALLVVGLLASCTSDTPPDSPGAPGSASATADASGSGEQSEFFEQADYERQLALAKERPQGPEGKPWEQMLGPELIDTTRYEKKEAGGVHLCFSNAGVFNPWRQVGLKNMSAEVELHKEI
ncbi:ABC transporter substrate-binding protein, partial [Streptomyces sp. NPDC056730]